MRRVLVTGGAGFVGANFVHYWLRTHSTDRVVVLDALTYAGNLASLEDVAANPNYRFVRGDICDATLLAALLHAERIDCVVHCAAESHVDRSIAGPDEFVRTNVLGTHTLLRTVQAWWSEGGSMRRNVRFHHVSTDEVYGSLTSSGAPFRETTAYAPSSPYSASKAAADHLVRAYHRTYALPVTTTHCSNNYGPFQFPEKLVPLMLVRALAGEPMPVYGRGENVRDWLHVEDHCRAIDVVLARGLPGETYNVGGGNEHRNIDVVQALCTALERKFADDATLAARFPQCPAATGRALAPLIRFVPDRPGHDWRYAIDSTKIAGQLGFAPSHDFTSGLASTLDWYLHNERWWRAVLSGDYCEQR